MIDLEFVQELIRTVDGSGIDHVEIERGGTRIRVCKTPPANSGQVPASAHSPESVSLPASTPPANPGDSAGLVPTTEEDAPAATDHLVEITSPMVGTFYRAPSPSADAFVEVGQRVSTGDVLCIIEAMKLMNELESDRDGVLREVCVEDGEPVEYGQVLFRVEPG